MNAGWSLEHFFAVKNGRERPFLSAARSRSVGAPQAALADLTTRQLWTLHDDPPAPCEPAAGEASLLDVKIALARRILRRCHLCGRGCGVDRLAGETGRCRQGAAVHCFQHAVLVGEEPFLVPSHELFFTGCNLRCRSCYAWQHIVGPPVGSPTTEDEFSAWTVAAARGGCDHVNLLGGEPTVNLPGILELLRQLPSHQAVVWNSNMTASPTARRLLDGVVDLYLGDFKVGNPHCAEALTGWGSLVEATVHNLRHAARRASLVVRHLVLPGHLECCLEPVVRRVAEEFPGVAFHLMLQYTPHWRAVTTPPLDRPLTPSERDKARRLAVSFDLSLIDESFPPGAGAPPATDPGSAFETEIAILPDGQVAVQQLSADLVDLGQTLTRSGGIS